MATQEDFINMTRNPSPQPGDGICPTVTQYQEVTTSSYEIWSRIRSEAEKINDNFHIADGLLEILQQTPGLYAHRSKGFSIYNQPFPQLKYALEWVTSTDPACRRPFKRTYHYLNLGIVRPLAWEYSNTSKSLWPERQADHMKHLSRLILAWKYILSSRWVEILNHAGEKASMNQIESISRENFWEVVTKQQWQATMTRDDKTFYAPWCIERHTVAANIDTTEALPDSLLAFRSLEEFCLSSGVIKNYVVMALAVVLMFPEHRTDPINLPPLVPAEVNHSFLGVEEKYYEGLSSCLSQCLTLSCCTEGIASLICSVFFEPGVPCNLIGAHLFGVREAIEPVKSDSTVFARLMVGQNPKVSSLWLAAIWTGRASKFLDSALGGMPPISLPMASWTGVLQSFIQVGYQSISGRDGYIPRATEFKTSYLIHPNAVSPFTPSPPFGEIATLDTSLDVREHLSHDHKLIQSTTYWISRTEQLDHASKQSETMDYHIFQLPLIARAPDRDGFEAHYVEDAVNRVASDATLNLFEWYRTLEGGILLEEYRRKHAWIIDDSDDSCSLGDNESDSS